MRVKVALMITPNLEGFEAVEWNRHERRLVVIGGIVLAHDGDEDLNLPRGAGAGAACTGLTRREA